MVLKFYFGVLFLNNNFFVPALTNNNVKYSNKYTCIKSVQHFEYFGKFVSSVMPKAEAKEIKCLKSYITNQNSQVKEKLRHSLIINFQNMCMSFLAYHMRTISDLHFFAVLNSKGCFLTYPCFLAR